MWASPAKFVVIPKKSMMPWSSSPVNDGFVCACPTGRLTDRSLSAWCSTSLSWFLGFWLVSAVVVSPLCSSAALKHLKWRLRQRQAISTDMNTPVNKNAPVRTQRLGRGNIRPAAKGNTPAAQCSSLDEVWKFRFSGAFSQLVLVSVFPRSLHYFNVQSRPDPMAADVLEC